MSGVRAPKRGGEEVSRLMPGTRNQLLDSLGSIDRRFHNLVTDEGEAAIVARLISSMRKLVQETFDASEREVH